MEDDFDNGDEDEFFLDDLEDGPSYVDEFERKVSVSINLYE